MHNFLLRYFLLPAKVDTCGLPHVWWGIKSGGSQVRDVGANSSWLGGVTNLSCQVSESYVI